MSQCVLWYYPDTEGTAMLGCEPGLSDPMKILTVLVVSAVVVYLLIRYLTRGVE